MRTVCDRGNPGSTQYSTAAGCRNSSFTILSSPADRARSRQGVVQSVRRPWLTGVQQGWRASPAHHLAGDALRRRRPSLWSNRRTAALTLSHRQRRLRAGLSFPAECTPAGVLVQPIVGAPLPTRPSSPAAGPTCGLPPEDPAELRPSTSSAATTDQTVCLGWELRLELRIRRIRSRRPRSFSFGHSLTAAQGYIDHQ